MVRLSDTGPALAPWTHGVSPSYNKTNDKVRCLSELDGKSRPENCKFQNPLSQLSIFWFIPSSRQSSELIIHLNCSPGCPHRRPHQATLVSHCISLNLPTSLPGLALTLTSPSSQLPAGELYQCYENDLIILEHNWSILKG